MSGKPEAHKPRESQSAVSTEVNLPDCGIRIRGECSFPHSSTFRFRDRLAWRLTRFAPSSTVRTFNLRYMNVTIQSIRSRSCHTRQCQVWNHSALPRFCPRLRRVRPTGHTVFRLTVGNRLQILLWNGGKEFCQPAEVPLLMAGNCRWAAWRMCRPLKFEPLVPRWFSCLSMYASAGSSVTRSSKLMGAFGSRFISGIANLKIREMLPSDAQALTAPVFTVRRRRGFELFVGRGRRLLAGCSLWSTNAGTPFRSGPGILPTEMPKKQSHLGGLSHRKRLVKPVSRTNFLNAQATFQAYFGLRPVSFVQRTNVFRSASSRPSGVLLRTPASRIRPSQPLGSCAVCTVACTNCHASSAGLGADDRPNSLASGSSMCA